MAGDEAAARGAEDPARATRHRRPQASPDGGDVRLSRQELAVLLLVADGLFRGQSLGKKLLGIKVIHLPTRQGVGARVSALRSLCVSARVQVYLSFLITSALPMRLSAISSFVCLR